MDLSKIIAISGKSGLFKIVSQTKGGLIVESLNDGKKLPVFATHKSSVLEDISMFTYSEDVPLKNVLWNIYQKEEGKPATVDPKADGKKLRDYFESVLQDHDKERVYTSDIKKVIGWYNQLLEHDLISAPKEEEAAAEEQAAEEQEGKKDESETGQTPPKAEKKKKSTTKKAKPKASQTPKPTSKSAAKKSTNTKQSKKS